jgi:hypothetical protein
LVYRDRPSASVRSVPHKPRPALPRL